MFIGESRSKYQDWLQADINLGVAESKYELLL
jgi:hypothetical protein